MPGSSLALYGSWSEAALVDPQRADTGFERRSRYAQSGGRPRRAEHLSAARAQRLLDDRCFRSLNEGISSGKTFSR